MKYLRIALCTATAAVALTALAGAGTASATELCSTSTTPCSGTKYNVGTSLRGSGLFPALTTSITTVTCSSSEFVGETSNNGGSGVAINGRITELVFFACNTSNGTKCSVSAVNLSYPLSINGGGTAAGSKSTITVTDAAGAGATVVCGFLINCTFTSTDATLNVENKISQPTATANVSLARSGGLCPENATWEISYTINTPSPLFVV